MVTNTAATGYEEQVGAILNNDAPTPVFCDHLDYRLTGFPHALSKPRCEGLSEHTRVGFLVFPWDWLELRTLNPDLLPHVHVR
jgi:hypothetical protein